jgi:hypothetical protein
MLVSRRRNRDRRPPLGAGERVEDATVDLFAVTIALPAALRSAEPRQTRYEVG